MYKFEMNQVLDESFLTKLVEKFRNSEVPKFDKLDRYYAVKNDSIMSRTMKAGKPNNKMAHGFARYITNIATSYFIGKPVQYKTDDKEYDSYLKTYFEEQYNYDYEISKSASKKGVAFELLYINENSELKSKRYEAQNIIPIYSSKINEFLNGFVRLYEENDIDGKLIKDYADVYDKESIYYFERYNKTLKYELVDIEEHKLSDVPLIVYFNNEEACGDYESVITQIDAYDKAQSNTGNDMDYFTDAYLLIKGASGGFVDENGNEIDAKDSERTLRSTRVMYLDDKGDAKFLTKEISDNSTENYKDRIFKDIFFISQVPPMTDESFAGDLSGIALRYKLIGLEQLSIMKENQMRLAKIKKLKLITDWLNIKKSKKFNSSTVYQRYTRNFIENLTETIENASKLEGVISKQTQISMLPGDIVDSTQEELQRIEEETRKKEGLFSELE